MLQWVLLDSTFTFFEVTELCREPIPFLEVQIGGVKEAGDEALGWQVAVAGLGSGWKDRHAPWGLL